MAFWVLLPVLKIRISEAEIYDLGFQAFWSLLGSLLMGDIRLRGLILSAPTKFHRLPFSCLINSLGLDSFKADSADGILSRPEKLVCLLLCRSACLTALLRAFFLGLSDCSAWCLPSCLPSSDFPSKGKLVKIVHQTLHSPLCVTSLTCASLCVTFSFWHSGFKNII
jgi:hypothetical protein